HFVVDLLAGRVVAAVLTFSFVVPALAGVYPSNTSTRITVFSDRYVLAGRAFDDLNLLEKHTTATQVRAVTLLACGPRVTRSLKAAVERFRRVPVQMLVLDADTPECSSPAPLATPVRERVGQRPYGIDDEAVERYWRDLMP
ncbi:MAG: hypothetical protein ACRD9W_13260, partial [Terriglobia bacterium]